MSILILTGKVKYVKKLDDPNFTLGKVYKMEHNPEAGEVVIWNDKGYKSFFWEEIFKGNVFEYFNLMDDRTWLEKISGLFKLIFRFKWLKNLI